MSMVRLSLDVSAELNALLERLARQSDHTKSEVLRRSIALAEVVGRAKRKGQRFGIVDGRGRLVTEIVGL